MSWFNPSLVKTMLHPLICLACVAITFQATYLVASDGFPPLGSAKSIQGELTSADFIHRTGQFRDADGKLTRFFLPPNGIMTYQGAESDLRDVPLATSMEFLMIPDDDGHLTQLVATKHGKAVDETQRLKFVAFTKARGLAGRIDKTEGKTITVTLLSGAPDLFTSNWGEDFDKGKDVRVCVSNDELRTWNPTSVAEKGTIVESESIPIEGFGNSGRRVVIRVGYQLEGFRPGRIVRIFGPGWQVQNQLFQECLINYGYSHRHAPDFQECWAKHYPEQFPFRTDYGNKQLPWFQAKEGTEPPQYAEHVVHGELTNVNSENQAGQFKTEDTGEIVNFTMLNTGAKKPAIRFQSNSMEGVNAKLADLALGIRYRFHLFQDANGGFTRCAFISDDFSQLALNSLNFQVRAIDPTKGRLEVTWQRLPVQNYQKEMETPLPFGNSLLQILPETRLWNDKTAAKLTDIKPGVLLKVNLTAELPGKPSHCADLRIMK